MSRSRRKSCGVVISAQISPLFDMLTAICGVRPVSAVLGFSLARVYYTTQLSDDQHETLQAWAAERARPWWSTGFGILEAADLMVRAAVENGNVEPPPFGTPEPSNPYGRARLVPVAYRPTRSVALYPSGREAGE